MCERVARYRRAGLGGGVFAEVDAYSSIFVIKYGVEFEARAEGFEVSAKRGDADVFGAFEFGDCALGDIESTGEFYLADCFAVA